MKLLTDENIALTVLKILRQQGRDVKDVKEESLQGSTDRVLIEIAKRDDRVIVTHDKDFGNLFHQPAIEHQGVVILRLKSHQPLHVAKVLENFLSSTIASKVRGSIMVVTEELITIHKHG